MLVATGRVGTSLELSNTVEYMTCQAQQKDASVWDQTLYLLTSLEQLVELELVGCQRYAEDGQGQDQV